MRENRKSENEKKGRIPIGMRPYFSRGGLCAEFRFVLSLGAFDNDDVVVSGEERVLDAHAFSIEHATDVSTPRLFFGSNMENNLTTPGDV